jgi:N-acyl homoserine lactone hydrolase
MPEPIATHRLLRAYVLDFGLFDVGPGQRIIGIPGFLLETDKGARILFDTGFPPDYATDPIAAAHRDGLARFGALVRHDATKTAAGQLALLGLVADDITHVILSHGHIDHVGALAQFAHAPIYMTQTEKRDARPCYFFDVQPMEWPLADYICINEPTTFCHGITLLPTPGHTLGHLSAQLTLPDGQSIILAADAINRASESSEGFADAKDPVMAQASYDLLMARQKATDALLIYGHEPTQWPKLRKAPAFYGAPR